jgi:hypothetical protein
MVTLQIDSNSIEQSRNKTITGSIYFDFGGYKFPEIGWNDFVVVVINWWLTALRNLAIGLSEFEKLSFMDGPFFLTIEKLDEDKCKIECFERYAENSKFSCDLSLKKLSFSILKAAMEVEAICIEQHWDTDDISELRSNIRTASISLK